MGGSGGQGSQSRHIHRLDAHSHKKGRSQVGGKKEKEKERKKEKEGKEGKERREQSLNRVRLFATPSTVSYQAPHPWDFPGKSTGVGCYFLLQIVPTQDQTQLSHIQADTLLSEPPGDRRLGVGGMTLFPGCPSTHPFHSHQPGGLTRDFG